MLNPLHRSVKRTIVLMVALLLAGLPTFALAQGGSFAYQEDPAAEPEILQRLEAIDPAAVPIFQKASSQLRSGDYEEARRGFEEVLQRTPDFADALRRESAAETALGLIEASTQHARRAASLDPRPVNRAAYALALLQRKDAALDRQAYELALSAAGESPADPLVNQALLWTAQAVGDKTKLTQAANALLSSRPDYGWAHYYAGLSAADNADWDTAERELLLAQQSGVPPNTVQAALDQRVTVQAALARGTRAGLYAVAAWVLGLALLLFLGILLSHITLLTVRRPRSWRDYDASGGEALIRGVYRLVILFTSAYFYLSIPFLAIILLVALAGLLYVFLVSQRVPFIVLLALALFVGITLFAIVRSLLIKRPSEEPGRLLPRDQAPQLWALVERVADRVGTRPADAIYLTPGSQVAVTERGGIGQQVSGHAHRYLILGLGVLQGMTQGQLQAILAHEFGHFTNRDTAGGDLAREVEAAIENMALSLSAADEAHWYNPAWLFVMGFSRVFAIIATGAARLQEILADRYAVMSYGTTNFVSGLEHMVRRSITFDLLVNRELEAAMTANRKLANLYTIPDELPLDLDAELEQRIVEVMSLPTGEYDSHPAPDERIDLIRRLNFGEGVVNDKPALALLPYLTSLQEEMTARVQSNLDQHMEIFDAAQLAVAGASAISGRTTALLARRE